jgi:hypothetical protein
MQKISEILAAIFCFNVIKLPLTGPDNTATPHFGLFRDDTFECVGNAVSAKYNPHTTDDVMAIVEATTSVFPDCVVNAYFNDGHYVVLQPTKDYRLSIFGNADNIFPRLIIRAGYDGKAFSVSMGYYRDLCKNMHIMRAVKKANESIRHTNSLRGKMDALIQQFQGLKEGWNNLGNMVQSMQGNTVQLHSFLEKVYGSPESDKGRGATIHKNRTKAIFDRVLRERQISGRGNFDSDYTVSVWEAFNAVQGYVQHDATRKGKPAEFDRFIASSNDAAVNRAETYAFDLVAA